MKSKYPKIDSVGVEGARLSAERKLGFPKITSAGGRGAKAVAKKQLDGVTKAQGMVMIGKLAKSKGFNKKATPKADASLQKVLDKVYNTDPGDARKDNPDKYYQLLPASGIGGVMIKKPKLRKQDAKFVPGVYYAVVWFPKLDCIGRAYGSFNAIHETLAQSPEAAVTRYLDRIHPSNTWENAHAAGNRVRRVKITDLGDA